MKLGFALPHELTNFVGYRFFWRFISDVARSNELHSALVQKCDLLLQLRRRGWRLWVGHEALRHNLSGRRSIILRIPTGH